MSQNTTKSMKSKIVQIKNWGFGFWKYCSYDVWNDTRRDWRINIIKTINLFVRSFLSADLQSKACALTYRTLLALVPALALICAIGRGFGLQHTIEDLLINQLPSQAQALETAFSFVDTYLSQASGGLFVGVGVIFLLWTLISLLKSVESTFNDIWLVQKNRSIWRMITDYLAIFLILPILLICASGISIFMSTSLSSFLPYGFMKPAIEFLFDLAGILFSWLFFAGTYILVPNTKVKFKTAIIPGILVGTACQILQWLFISGQMYVAKYNAIYGSFSFLPLFLIWIQLVWLFTLIGGVLCYSIQNIGGFNFGESIKNISENYRRQATIAILTIIAKRFYVGQAALSISEISQIYKLPINLVTLVTTRLNKAGLINYIHSSGKDSSEYPIQPAIDISTMTIGHVIKRLQELGSSNFLPEFNTTFSDIIETDISLTSTLIKEGENTKLIDLNINI